ncbi:MAG: PepSY domain-containing protein [Nitrososphaeraceae archaeon]
MQTIAFFLFFVGITTTMSISSFIPNSIAQPMMNNQTMMDQGTMPQGSNLNGSINIESTFSEALTSKINIDIMQALETAKNDVGPHSMIIGAQLESNQGFLVYSILLLDNSEKLHEVTIDPGTGKILVTKDIGKMMMGPQQGMMMGPQQGMMMGPQQGMMMGPQQGMIN